MIKEFADDAAQQKNVARFRDVLKERDLPATATSFISLPPLADSHASVAGSEACRDCHAEDHKQWATSGHAHAWASLQKTRSEVDATCQHAT